jgi:LysR family transcriptional activator of glutamate synthase operon
MDTRKLEYLLTIVETGSVTEAAKKLYISQPALSQTIRYFEQLYHIRIFEKKEGRMNLTPEGRIFIDAARRQFFIEKNMVLQLNDMKEQLSGDITIGLSPSRSLQFLPALMPKMKDAFPKVRLVVNTRSSSGFEKEVVRGKLDFAFVMDIADVDPALRNELTYIPLFSYDTLLAVPPNHPLAREAEKEFDWRKRRAISLDEVRNEPFICTPPFPRSRRWTDTIYNAYGFKPREAVVISGGFIVYSLVQAGIGFALTQDTTAFAMKRGAFFRLDKGPFLSRLCVIYRKDRFLSKPMEFFINTATDLAKTGYWNKI